MQFRTSVKTIYKCSLERAFRSPMLCDVTKVHTGWLMMPKVSHCLDDESWGCVGGSRRVFIEKNFFYDEGEAALDTILERVENRYWKIEITDLKYFLFGIKKFQGEWATRELAQDKIEITYTYTLFSEGRLLFPLHWLITKVFWRIYMKHVLEKVRNLAHSNANYTHA